MEVVENNKNEKLSYEQLEQVCHQLSEQSRTLYAKVQELSVNNLLKRLDFLFKVLDHSELFSAEFVHECVADIEEALKVPEEENESEE